MPKGTDNPRVQEVTRGDKTFGVTLEGNKVPGMNRWGGEVTKIHQPPRTPRETPQPDAERRWRAGRSRKRRCAHRGARQREGEEGAHR